jgi:hypothetical protein
MAILLLLHEPPKDEPAQQQDVANSFSNRSDGRPVSGVQPNSFRRRCRATEKSPSLAEGLVIYLKKFMGRECVAAVINARTINAALSVVKETIIH